MNNTYQDDDFMWHDKPCVNGRPSSNNPAIYTAYAKAFGLDYSDFDCRAFFNDCIEITGRSFVLDRIPGKKFPRTSIDEIVGWVSLGIIKARDLEKFNWRFFDQTHNPSKWKIFKAMVYLVGEHRNFVQDQKVRDAHPIVFWVPWHFQYYIKKVSGEEVSLFESVVFCIHCLSMAIQNNNSNKNLTWLMLRDLGSRYLVKLFNYRKSFCEEFGKDHPFCKEAKLLR